MTENSFPEFVQRVEPMLRHGLVARFGATAGREAAVDVSAWAWPRWDRIREMTNPVRYLYRVAVYAEFRATFKDQPSIVENVDPDTLPLFYRVDLTDLRDGRAVVAAVDHLPGVRKVVHAGFDR